MENAIPLHAVFQNTCHRYAGEVAIIDNGKQVTYGELFRHVSILYEHLVTKGVKREARIGVFIERSLESVISFLAIIRAGATYVPLDPALPTCRLAHIIKDASLSWVITDSKEYGRLPDCKILLLFESIDFRSVQHADEYSACLADDTRSSDLAYILYTSGSSGLPKGVMVGYGALTNYLKWRLNTFNSGPGEIFLHKAPVSFDMSIAEILCALLGGSTLVIFPQQIIFNIDCLRDLISRYQVSTISLVPSLLNILLDDWSHCRSLRQVLCGGETLSAAVANTFMAATSGKCELYNIYGPTEATLAVSCYRVKGKEQQESIPIGRPIDNVEFRIRGHNKSNTGDSGELLITGVCLAHGYLNDPALNRKRFIYIKDRSMEKRQYFLTGDFVKRLGNGEYVFLGRQDEQIKFNGCRIDLGEIEAVLEQYPDFQRCAVVKQGGLNQGGLNQGELLTAFVQLSAGSTSRYFYPLHLIRKFLLLKLPRYAWPSRIICLDRLPINHNGKIDKACLRLKSWDKSSASGN